MQFTKWFSRVAVFTVSLSLFPALAQVTQQKGMHVDCQSASGGSTIYWLFVNVGTGECGETAKDVYECWDPASTAASRLTCDVGCDFYTGDAGCQVKARRVDANLVTPNLDVSCPDGGRDYRITDTNPNASCSVTEDAGGSVTGATCTVGVNVTAELDCDRGCLSDGGTAACQIL